MFIILLYIFFFKQKTAYDMRISDWSSDVCSSDLAPTHPHGAFAETRLEWEMWNNIHPTGEPLDIGLVVETMIDRLPANTIICNGAGNYSEIGRASCRERVCQYV